MVIGRNSPAPAISVIGSFQPADALDEDISVEAELLVVGTLE